MKKPLFPQIPEMLHGGDYNPEQWLDRPDILEEDLRMMKLAGVNMVSLGMFSWSMLEPEEGVFNLDWLEDIINNLYKNGVYVSLGTPSGARPAWLDKKYPEAMRVSDRGVRNLHGVRHNHCPSSPAYREKVKIIDTKLAQRFGDHPAVVLWHISNEMGGECYCELCEKRFQDFLRERYNNDIEELNKAWWTIFWSHKYQDFDQIEVPVRHGERSIAGLLLDWKRFTTWNTTDFLKFEKKILQDITPDIPATTNFMRLYYGLDYYTMSQEVDFISWDVYPIWLNDYETLSKTARDAAFDFRIMGSFQREHPFLLMESVTDQVNWHQFNRLKRPGLHRLSSLQAVACGSDSVLYFQWRKGRGSFEQHHGAVVGHLGTEHTRVFQEVAEVGEMLQKLQPVVGATTKAEAAILFDWDSRWALTDVPAFNKDKKYDETCKKQYEILSGLGVELDIISPLQDFSQYKMLVVPMLYVLKPGFAKRLQDYVNAGGTVVASYFLGYVDESTLSYLGGSPGDTLQELFGMYVEEIDILWPTQKNLLDFGEDGAFQTKDLCEVIHTTTAETKAVYGKEFYQGQPAVTKNAYGKGNAYYVASRLEDEGLEYLYRQLLVQAGIQGKDLPSSVEYHIREGNDATYEFYLNFSEETVILDLSGKDLLSGESYHGKVSCPPDGAFVLENKKIK